MAGQRSAQEVLDDHLATSLTGSVGDELGRNYAPEVVIVSNWGVKGGHDGMPEMARLLRSQLLDCTFAYRLRLIEGGRAAGVERRFSGRLGPRRGRLVRDLGWADSGADDPLHPRARPQTRPACASLRCGGVSPGA
jgi:hypothetical protein